MKITIKKRIAVLLICCLMAAGAVILLPDSALSYLSSIQEADLDIRAKPAQEMWKMEGDFQVERWKNAFSTGIQVTNLTPSDDLWIYFEYTGDLKNVFQQQDPVLLAADTTVELQLNPLDNQDSPRVLNPSDIVNAEGQWRNFCGTIRVHTLNKYATLETNNIIIPGSTLWDVLFAQKFKEGAEPEVDEEGQALVTMQAAAVDAVTGGAAAPVDVEQEATQAVKEAGEFTAEIRTYQPLEIMIQVSRIIEKVAPGLLKEQRFLLEVTNRLVLIADRLTRGIERLIEDRHRLQCELESHRTQIQQLNDELASVYARNMALEGEIQLLQPVKQTNADSGEPAPNTNNPGEGNSPAPEGAGETGNDKNPASQGDSGNSSNGADNQEAETNDGNTGSSGAESSSGSE